MKKTAVFTISSANYFAQAKTLLDSLRRTNPSWDRYFGLCDDINDDIIEACRSIDTSIVEMKDLDIPDLNDMKFRYNVLELNTAIKPFVFLHLLKKYDRVVYMDPDICVYAEMTAVNKAFDDGYEFVITPHFTGYWEEDGKHPDEPDIMRAGIYNFGFFAAANCPDAKKVIGWWANKLETLCINKQEEGIFVDQKWMDLLPARHEKVYILRHNGYNIAYWNLQQRKASYKDGQFYFAGDPLVFFHFSGYNSTSPDNISKHQNRFSMDDIGVAKKLFFEYAQANIDNGFDKWKKYLYSFTKFSDGRELQDIFRYMYREIPEAYELVGGRNPFDCSDVFYDNKEKLAGPLINYICSTRRELGGYMLNTTRQQWLAWFEHVCKFEYKMDDEWVDFIRYFLKGHLATFNSEEKIVPEPMVFTPRRKEDGVNLIGYIKSEHGMGEACRLVANALSTTQLKWNAYDWELNNPSRKNDCTWDAKITSKINYNISIFNINADQLFIAKEHLPAEAWEGYRIGIWYWELTEFPEQWCPAFELVDEIWAPTKFIQENLAKKATCPVIYMPPGLKREEPDPLHDRKYFGLPEDTFLYLNMFDAYSYTSRKNPSAAITAFQMAFKPDDMSVGLVLKVNNMSEEDENYKSIKKAVADYKNIHIIAKTMNRDEINGLINCCDVSVSLHRSEGLGLLCEESMYFGKPVIATGWSGNTDFMTKDTACLVDYKLVPIGEYYGTNDENQKWAEADVQDACNYMIRLYEDKAYYDTIASNAKKHIRGQFSPEVCGARMAKRISEIKADKKKVTKYDLEKKQAVKSQQVIEQVAQPEISLLEQGSDNSIMQDLQVINSLWTVEYNRPIEKVGSFAGVRVFMKRAIRYLCRPLIQPIVDKQRCYNSSVTRILNELESRVQGLTQTNVGLVKEMQNLQQTNALLQQENCNVQQKNNELFHEIEEMKKKNNEINIDVLQVLEGKMSQANERKYNEILANLKTVEAAVERITQEARSEIMKGVTAVKDEQIKIFQHTGSWYNALVNMYMQINHSLQKDSEKSVSGISEAIRSKWQVIDKYYIEPKNVKCCICGASVDTSTAERLESQDIFGGGKLIRYTCPICGAIVGPCKMLELSEEEFSEEYKFHYMVNVESESSDAEIETFMALTPEKGKKYLNYGCGGWNAAIEKLRSQGYDVYGFDPYAPNDSQYIISDVNVLKQLKFDGIFSHDLLEHLREPVEVFKLFSEILKDDGAMAHSTACYKYLYEYDRFHLIFYTGDAIKELCNRTGFKVKEKLEDDTRLVYNYIYCKK